MDLNNILIPTGILKGTLSIGGPLPPYVAEWITLTDANGNSITFDTDIIANLYKCLHTIKFNQAGSGTPSPSNPRLITGFDKSVINLNGNTFNISYGAAGVVYQGTLNAITGVLTVTHGYLELDSITWQTITVYQGHTAFMSAVVNVLKANTASSQVPDVTCSHYPTLNGDGVYLARLGISLWSTQKRFAIFDADKESMSGEDFKSSLVGVQTVFLLENAVNYDLAGHEFVTISGSNSINVNSGSLDITYLESINNKLGG